MSRAVRGQVLPDAPADTLSPDVLCSALWAGGNTRAYRSIREDENNQRQSKPVPMLVEDQSNCILLSINENATKGI